MNNKFIVEDEYLKIKGLYYIDNINSDIICGMLMMLLKLEGIVETKIVTNTRTNTLIFKIPVS